MALALQPMAEADYIAWREQSVVDYAADKVTSGEWEASAALRLAQDNLEKILPQGFATPDHYFYLLREESSGQPCGHLWFARQAEGAYLYDIAVAPGFRGRGYGRTAMQLFEQTATKLGLRSLRLHVFGANRVARSLYESLGFETTNLWMRKQLDCAD